MIFPIIYLVVPLKTSSCYVWGHFTRPSLPDVLLGASLETKSANAMDKVIDTKIEIYQCFHEKDQNRSHTSIYMQKCQQKRRFLSGER